jgi:pimeloyl-ACP methyl ester carboxylesterase
MVYSIQTGDAGLSGKLRVTAANVSHTEAYTIYDHVFLKALRSVSRVFSVTQLTRPFWNRWRAGDTGDDVLFGFLDSIRNLDDWPQAAERMILRETAAFDALRGTLGQDDMIAGLRRLSYMCNLAHWGIMPLTDIKRTAYLKARDYYLEAEQMAFGPGFRRLFLTWGGQKFPANLHLPRNANAPLVILVHGIDGCKEEHLATELVLLEHGLAVLSFDGPGQAESFLINGIMWSERFPELISAAIDAVADLTGLADRPVGVMGMSIGATWGYVAAARDSRIGALYDLGAAINSDAFQRVPFIIKSKVCQITGARTDTEIRQVLAQIKIDLPDLLGRIAAAIRIVHGSKDRVVALTDKQWLAEELKRIGSAAEVSTRVFDGADHCCTGEIPEVRRDMAAFFTRVLGNSA